MPMPMPMLLDKYMLITFEIKIALYFATQFGCSTRTLRRQLEQCGTDYQSLLSEVRGDIAKEYLLGTSLTIEEIALRLGYCDGSSFRRKFKRLSGYTPRAYRYAGKELRYIRL